ncbi:MACD2 deacetylase, partial [Aramus guarauna]|nr:MACD2 deacetylase [Aramus guarauna]
AFPCISTGIYGFPNEPAAVIALNTIKEWLSKNHNEVDRIIFCVFLEVDYKIFRKKMGEFFPLDDANEEGTEPIEETGLEQKGQPPSPTKSKAEQPEDLQDDAEGGNGTEKQNTEETEAQSRESDEPKRSAVADVSSSQETELSEDKDSLKDSKGARESDPVYPVGCEQDQAKGQQDVSAEEDMKTGADSQSSCMEVEEALLNQEDTTEVEMSLIHGAEEKEEGGKEDKEGGMQGKEEASVELMKVDLACEAADVSNKDAEMNSQVESINDPTETGREA